mgnify:CR=1 FL=1
MNEYNKMKYLIFDWTKCDTISDLSEISDEEFECLAKKYGKVFNNYKDFEAEFNSEIINTDIHQLRIII